jgi:hypothetical protein
MKRLMICFFVFVSLLFFGYPQNDAVGSTVNPSQSPVMFVPGLTAGPGSAFYNMYEKFESQGYPKEKMAIALLPKIGVPYIGDSFDYAWHCIVPGEYYDRNDWIASGNTHWNVPALFKQIKALRDSTGAAKVDLVGHSNGNALIRELLAYVYNPTDPIQDPFDSSKTIDYNDLQGNIGKVVFIAGFASVDDADISNILTYLDDVAPDSLMPTTVNYYALKSETDLNSNQSMDVLKLLYYIPQNFDTGVFTLGSGYTKYNDSVLWTVNGVSKSIDHERLPTHPQAISKVFNWLTGQSYVSPSPKTTVTISGRIIVQDGCSNDNPCNQSVLTNGLVEAKYYDISTGVETGTAGSGSSTLSSDGRYTITGLQTNKYLKITVTNNNLSTSRGNNSHPKSVFFLADQIKQDSRNLDFYAPILITDDYANGKVAVKISCAYSAISKTPYLHNNVTRDADTYSGNISTYYYTTKYQDSTCLPKDQPTTTKSLLLKNFGSTNVNSLNGNEYNFINPDNGNGYESDYLYFYSMHVYVTAKLNNGNEVKARISGSDRYNNIRNHIMYLYRD